MLEKIRLKDRNTMSQQQLNRNTIVKKSTRGRMIISSHAIQLTRAERNFLIIANGQLTIQEIITMLGIPFDTVNSLLENKLLEVSDWGESQTLVSQNIPQQGLTADPIQQKLNIALPPLENSSPFHRLYAFLSIQIPEFFGILSFTQILKLERASDINELAILKDNLLEKVKKKYGEIAYNAYQEKINLLTQELKNDL